MEVKREYLLEKLSTLSVRSDLFIFWRTVYMYINVEEEKKRICVRCQSRVIEKKNPFIKCKLFLNNVSKEKPGGFVEISAIRYRKEL